MPKKPKPKPDKKKDEPVEVPETTSEEQTPAPLPDKPIKQPKKPEPKPDLATEIAELNKQISRSNAATSALRQTIAELATRAEWLDNDTKKLRAEYDVAIAKNERLEKRLARLKDTDLAQTSAQLKVAEEALQKIAARRDALNNRPCDWWLGNEAVTIAEEYFGVRPGSKRYPPKGSEHSHALGHHPTLL